MACTGPSKALAEYQAKEAFEEIMSLLKEKYHINRWSYPVPEDAERSSLQCAVINCHRRAEEDWDEKAEDVKQALVELFWSQHCMDF